MANYLDLMNQLQDRRRADLSEFNPTNPYSSSAYTYQDAGDLYNQAQGEALQDAPEGYIPSEYYESPSMEQKVTSGISNISTASTAVNKLSSPLSKIGQKVIDKGLPQGMTALPPATIPNFPVGDVGHVAGVEGVAGAGGVMGAAPATIPNPNAGMSAAGSGAIAAAAYTIANDNNPYTYKAPEAVGMGVGDYMATKTVMGMAGVAVPWVPIAAAALGYLFRSKKAKKLEKQERELKQETNKLYSQNMIEERRKRNLMSDLSRKAKGNTIYGGALSNQNTMGASGMKYNYNSGGVNLKNVTAEFTGNELIVNNQNTVEEGIAEKNYAKAAKPIREAMRGGRITPGPETHQNNPMPVTSDGSIYAGGGALPFKVGDGAGIYDHASDQFKSTMSDKQIAMVAEKNIKKWKSNNMYS